MEWAYGEVPGSRLRTLGFDSSHRQNLPAGKGSRKSLPFKLSSPNGFPFSASGVGGV